MGLGQIIDAAYGIVTSILIPLAFSLCLFYFFWGVAKYIKSEGDGKAEGKSIMVWGLVGIFVAFSIWGIIIFIRNEFGLTNVPTTVERSLRGSANSNIQYQQIGN